MPEETKQTYSLPDKAKAARVLGALGYHSCLLYTSDAADE